ncbi:MAG TPA: MJ0042-type zinc finger domain-containing protein [Pseudolabrys sp.]|nr:MJ0042-type zinc finger domain-containing protein [Pseudolabrys sp.]
MLIVCPNCATSYMIDPASVGPAGRSVRCARCKSTWFATSKGAGATAPGVSAFVDGVIAEAEAESATARGQSLQSKTPPPAEQAAAPDDLSSEQTDDLPSQLEAEQAPTSFDTGSQDSNLVPDADTETVPGDGEGAVTTDDAPSLVPQIENEPFSAHHSDGPVVEGLAAPDIDSDEIESYTARRERLKVRRQKSKRTSRWTAIALVLFAFNVALIGARNEVVRYLPQTASLFAAIGITVNLRDLKFEDVKITKETTDGVSILVIDGKIVNTVSRPTEVPRLRFAARNATGRDVYTWTSQPARPVLGPKESMEFHSRLAAPPAEARDVMVRFFTPQDAAGGK